MVRSDRPVASATVTAAVHAAGVKQIDYLVISHYDIDHLGDVPLLLSSVGNDVFSKTPVTDARTLADYKKAAQDMYGADAGTFLKLFPVYLFIIPGLICFALAKSGKVPGLASVYDPATGHATAAAQGAFPLMVSKLLPPGLRGIVVAGLLSALMGFSR